MDPIREWVEKERKEWTRFEAAHVVLGLAGGVVVLYFTYLLLYFLTWFATVGWLDLSSGALMMLSAVWLALVVWAAVRGDHERSESLALEVGGEAQRGEGFSFPTMGGYRINPFATALAGAAFLYVGPRMIRSAWRGRMMLARLRRLDAAGCAELLRPLLMRPGRVELRELTEGRPELDTAQLIPQLEALRAVTILPGDPPAVVLPGRTRAELLAFLPGEGFRLTGRREGLAP